MVPLSLIYADLLMIGDARCLKTADMIHERIVDGSVKQEGAHLDLRVDPGCAYAPEGRYKEIRKEHRNIYDALRRRDPETARTAAQDHVRNSGLAQLANIMNNG